MAIRSPTVFIVGAGASKEADLPLGNELKTRIAQALDLRYEDFGRLASGDPLISECLHHHIRKTHGIFPNLLKHCREIVAGMPGAISIDNYLHQRGENPDLALCAKLAIVQAIAEAERRSFLYVDPRRPDDEISFSRLDHQRAWYIQLGRMVAGMARFNDLGHVFDNLAFVTFNYDRCIQHFFLRFLMTQYSLSEQAAAPFVQRLPVHHVYGSIGTLPWLHPEGVGVPFGESLGTNVCLEGANQIRTFTEAHTDVKLQTAIHDAIARAHTVVYLGFAYHDISMQLIRPKQEEETRRIFATRYKISEPNWIVCRNSLIHDRRWKANTPPEILEGDIDSQCGAFLADWERPILA